MCYLIVIILGFFTGFVTSQGYYEVIGPRSIRPNSEYHCAISIQATSEPTSVTTTIEGTSSYNGSIFRTEDVILIPPYSTAMSKLVVPNISPGEYKLKVVGQGGLLFESYYPLEYLEKSYSVLIQTDRSVYKPGSVLRFRAVILNSQLKPAIEVRNEFLSVRISDGKGNYVKQWDRVSAPRGVFTEELTLGEHCVLGIWNISVTLHGQVFNKSTEVAEYVLPKFIVDIKSPQHVTFKDGKIIARIQTRYNYGKIVKGEATATVYPTIFSGVIQPIFQNPVRRVIPIEGDANVEFEIDSDLKLSDEYERLVILDVTVEESNTGRRQNNSVGIHIHKYNYKIDVIKTADYFKPGLKYVAYVKVVNHDGTPINSDRNEISVKHGYSRVDEIYTETRHTLDENGLVKLEYLTPSNVTNTTALRIEVEYQDLKERISPIPAAVSFSNNFVQATLLTDRPIVNLDVEISIRCTEPMKYINYILLGRGDVLIANTFQVYNKKEYDFRFTATHAMVPVSHLIVSYVRENGELIGDSLSIEVDGLLQNFIDIQVNTLESDPNLDLDLTIRAQPNSYIGLLAVDQHNDLLGMDYDLTRQQISEELATYDTASRSPYSSFMRDAKSHFFWKPGSSNAHSSIYDSGADLLTNAHVLRHKPTLEDIYLRPVFYGSSTVKPDRGLGLSFPSATRPPLAGPYAFSRIPRPVWNKPKKYLSQDIEDTWLFSNFSSGYNGITSVRRRIPNSLNKWIISGFSLDPLYGLGLITAPKVLTVSKAFFVTLDLPYSVQRDEIIGIPVVVYNNMEKDIKVEVTLHNPDQKFQFAEVSNEINATKKIELYRRKRLSVKAKKGASVSFMVTPNHLGSIEMKVTASSPNNQDMVVKYLQVKAEGETEFYTKSIMLDLRKVQNFKQQLNFTIPQNAVTGSEKIEVSAVGDVLGPVMRNLENLIRIPTGCGEQTLVRLMPNVIILKYLKNSGQDTPTIQNEAMSLLETSYQEQLSFKRMDGTFSAFGDKDSSSSVWITAYVILSLREAKQFIYVDEYLIENGLEWLANIQSRNGSFIETGNIIHSPMQNNYGNNLALTAFVLLAFIEGQGPPVKYRNTVNKGLDYIARNIDENQSIYSIALCSYVLQLTKHTSRQSAFNILDVKAKSGDNIKWWGKEVHPGEEKNPWNNLPNSVDIETTSYALLTFLEANLIEDSLPVVNWLLKQENNLGGFTSSHDTVIVLYALLQLVTKLSVPTNIQIELDYKEHQTSSFHINKNSAMIEQKLELNNNIREVNITAQGSGLALFRLSYQYNMNVTGPWPLFTLDPQVDKNSNKDHLQISICTGFVTRNLSEISNMAIMEVSLPSGFTVDTDSLPSLEVSQNVQKVETSRGLTNVILYFNNITRSSEYCPTVSAFRTHKVAKQKPVAVLIYDYYDSSRRARSFYQGRSTTLCDICENEDCGNICALQPNPQIGEQKQKNNAISSSGSIILIAIISLVTSKSR